MSYEQWLAALCLWREARGCSMAALTGIWHVIQNRVNDSQHRWPKSISGVILQHAQFSSFLQSDPNVVKFPIPIPGSIDWIAFVDCQNVVSSPLNADPTNGANSYESLPVNHPKPSWADPKKLTLTIGNIRFYKL